MTYIIPASRTDCRVSLVRIGEPWGKECCFFLARRFPRLGIGKSVVQWRVSHPIRTRRGTSWGQVYPLLARQILHNKCNDWHRDLPAISFAHTRHYVACQPLLEGLMEVLKFFIEAWRTPHLISGICWILEQLTMQPRNRRSKLDDSLPLDCLWLFLR